MDWMFNSEERKAKLAELGLRHVSLIFGQPVTWKWDPECGHACITGDHREVRFNPEIFESLTRDNLELSLSMFQGVCLHEGSHGVWTDSEVWFPHMESEMARLEVVQSLGNQMCQWAEDCYIEGQCGRKFPGFKKHFINARKFIFPDEKCRESLDTLDPGDPNTVARAMIIPWARAEFESEFSSQCPYVWYCLLGVRGAGEIHDTRARVTEALTWAKKLQEHFHLSFEDEQQWKEFLDMLDGLFQKMEQQLKEEAKAGKGEGESGEDGEGGESGDGEVEDGEPKDGDPKDGEGKKGKPSPFKDGEGPINPNDVYRVVGQAQALREGLFEGAHPDPGMDAGVLAENKHAAEKLRRELKFRDQPVWSTVTEFGLKVGDLDEDALAGVGLGDTRIWSNTEEGLVRKQDVDLAVLLDESASMETDDRWSMSCAAIACIQYAVAALASVRLRVYGFSTEYTSDNESTVVFKHFDDSDGAKAPYLWTTHPKWNNLDGTAIEAVRAELEGSRRSKIILMISDGQPVGKRYGGKESFKHVADAVARAEKDGCTFMHVQIGDACVTELTAMYGKRWKKLHSTATIPSTICSMVGTWLRK